MNRLLLLTLSLSKDNKELQQLKTLNSSLTKDNKELRQSIDRLNDLDMQLKRKAR